MSLKATINFNNVKFGVGDGSFYVYDHENHELERYEIKNLGYSELTDTQTKNVISFAISLPNGDTVKLEHNQELSQFAKAFKEEKYKE